MNGACCRAIDFSDIVPPSSVSPEFAISIGQLPVGRLSSRSKQPKYHTHRYGLLPLYFMFSRNSYDYAQILKNLGQVPSLNSAILPIATSWSNWSHDPKQLEGVRQQLGQQLHRRCPTSENAR